MPGESVFAWRLGKNIQGTTKTGVHKGQWLGPAKVLGTETKKNPDGTLAPASVIWVIVKGRLWRCAPQQLRRASERELAEEKLKQKRPWTFENMTKDIVIGEYSDIRDEEPCPETEDEGLDGDGRASNANSEGEDGGDQGPPNLTEDSNDEPAKERDDEEMDSDVEPAETKKSSKRGAPAETWKPTKRLKKTSKRPHEADFAQAEESARRAMEQTQTGYFADAGDFPERVVEIAFPEIDSDRKVRRFLKNPECLS